MIERKNNGGFKFLSIIKIKKLTRNRLNIKNKTKGEVKEVTFKQIGDLKCNVLTINKVCFKIQGSKLWEYLPRVSTIGHMQSLVKDMVKLRLTTGLKFKRRGYKSIGLSVPDVITTD